MILWSLGDTWYVQPFADKPFTVFGPDGKFQVTIHGGYRFAAMLVNTGHVPKATLSSLPRVAGGVLAITIVKPKK